MKENQTTDFDGSEELLRIPEAARRSGLPERCFRNNTRPGNAVFPFLKCGRYTLIPWKRFLRFLEEETAKQRGPMGQSK